MPKMKTRKLAKKRFRITKNGKVVHLLAGNAKLKAHKSKSKKRRYDSKVTLTNKKEIKMIKSTLCQ